MTANPYLVTPVAIPPNSAILQVYPSISFADAYAIALPAEATDDPETLARFIFSQQSAVVSGLLVIRDAVMGLFGVKTSKQLRSHPREGEPGRIGIFRIYDSASSEIVLGEDDKHLDFRLSLICRTQPQDARRIVVSTVVHCHNWIGRSYIRLIAPFHRAIVKAALRRAARKGWPASSRSGAD